MTCPGRARRAADLAEHARDRRIDRRHVSIRRRQREAD